MGSPSTQARAANGADLSAYVASHIHEAIDNGWVKPYYQPVIRTLTGKLCGFEALARWDDPTYGLLPPETFIPVLEEAKLIHLLDCSIIRQVCEQYLERKKCSGVTVPISFNLSRLDFDLCDVFSVVEQAAYEFVVPRSMLNIEVTESALGSNPEFMVAMIRKFHDAGYEVWMDDFGSGYSTLNVLKDFDFNELKIDMEFLSHFNEKAKAILASVVDMAKKLGIHTLAEGVETPEHRDFLRSIGCEKMQGYLFGKPEPFDPNNPSVHFAPTDIEAIGDCRYISDVGAVNTLSLSEHDLSENSSTSSYLTSMPIALIEYANDTYRIIESNDAFREGLAHLGIPSLEAAEILANDPKRPFAHHTRQMMKNIEKDLYARFDYAFGNSICVIRARHITSQNGKTALILSFGDTIAQSDKKRHDRMNDLLSVVFSIYDLVSIIHLDKHLIEPVFDNFGQSTDQDAIDFDVIVNQFMETNVYEDDRQRFLDFMNHDTMIDRITNSGEKYLVGFFRLRQNDGNYTWKLFSLFPLPDQPGSQVMLCVRGTHWESNDLLHMAFGKHHDGDELGPKDHRPSITDGSLWRAMSHGMLVRLFWKDANRRFAGANQAFLDYYGFESVDDIVGKNDEDMGWHIDPTPFKEAEERVLREGIPIESVSGHCIVNGENRTIVTSKYPVYRNGRIVGLVGCFLDTESDKQDGIDLSPLAMRDNVTGVLNFTGLEAATWQHVDTYKRQGIDFAMISINIDNFDRLNTVFGNTFGDQALKRVADELLRIAGHQRIVAHVYANRFVILEQDLSDEELQGICDEIERSIGAIAEVDGTPCTIYALASFSRFSQHGNVEAMKLHNRDQRVQRRKDWTGKSDEDDIITSSLLKD